MSSMKSSRVSDLDSIDTPRGVSADPQRKNPLEMIWHRKWIVLLSTGLCVLAAFIVYKTMTPIYTSYAEIEIQVSASRTGDKAADAAANNNATTGSNLYTQAKVVTSTAVIADAVGLMDEKWKATLQGFKDKLQIAQDEYDKVSPRAGDIEYEAQVKEKLGDLTRSKADLATAQAAYDHFQKLPDQITTIKNGIHSTIGTKDEVLSVSYDSAFPEEARLVVASVIEAYVHFSSADKPTSTAKDSLDKINAEREKWMAETSSGKDKMVLVQDEIRQLKSQGTDLQIDQKLKSLTEAVASADLDSMSTQAAYEEFARSSMRDQTKLNTLLSTGMYNGAKIVPGSDDRSIRQDMHTAQQALSELQQRYLPNHPAVQSAQARVEELNAQYALYLHEKWISAKNKVAAFQERYQDQRKAADARSAEVASELTRKTLEFAQLEASQKQAMELMENLTNRSRDLHFDDFGTMNVKVLEQANLPTIPTRPVKSTLLFEGLLVGLILGISLSFLDSRLRSVEEITATSGLPVLGVIPHMPRSASAASRGRKVHLDPMSDVSEAYRAIRTAVYFGPRGAKTILVTSPMRGEGKSTLASNLAIAMAEAGQKVLLVDSDLRLPTQHRIFATNNEVGLSTVVAGRTSADRSIQSSQIKGLEILPCGPVPFNPSETINNQTFADMLQDLSTKYDYVVVDSPPVMAVTDARILGAMCDLTLMVVRAEKTNRKNLADARDGLLGFGANLLGIVVNDGKRDKSRHSYYGGYGANKGGSGKQPAQVNGGRPATPLGGDVLLSHIERD